jgi:spore germination protein GerM
MDNEKKDGETNGSQQGKGKKLLVAWIVWLLFSIILIAITGPSIRRAVLESGVMDLIEQKKPKDQDSSLKIVEACFYAYDGSYALFAQKQRTFGGTVYHDCFENLLSGPDYYALASGAVTYIAPGTSLIGLTLSNGILYIDLSKDFLASLDLKRAFRQIIVTATNFSRIKDVVVLVEGQKLPNTEGNPT